MSFSTLAANTEVLLGELAENKWINVRVNNNKDKSFPLGCFLTSGFNVVKFRLTC